MRVVDVSRAALLGALGLLLSTQAGCNQHPVKPIEYDLSGSQENQIQLTVNKDVDILFVIDNSGSMGDEQANLAANFGAFIEELEAKDVEANYRIGITTTDNGNPWCGATTTPEGGALVLSSCQSRLEHFVFQGTNPPTDATETACTNICPYTAEELDDMMVATATDIDPNEKVRPWLENIEGKSNLPEGISTAEAFQCFGPQGIDGCGFESHLESMYKALQRTQSTNEASYGFLRRGAILAIVIVTDEVDCSHNDEWNEIFKKEGNRVFWSDPDADAPSSAVCWNAGVKCEGGPGQYDSCKSANLDVDGNLTDDPDAAVMRPLDRYVDLIQGFEDQKKMHDPSQEVIVGVIGGVPSGYYQDMGEIVYADAPDDEFQGLFGIGPGCTSVVGDETQTAVPPVRMREWAENFGDRNLYSVCSPDYRPALKEIARRIEDQIQPACYARCVADTDAAEPGLQANCNVEEQIPGGTERLLPECRLVGGEYQMPSADDNVCHYKRTDPTGAGSDLDDMSDACVEQGLNLEFEILRREGFPAAGGSSITATCELSDFPSLDCPDL